VSLLGLSRHVSTASIYMRPPRMDTAQQTLVRQRFNHRDFLFELKHDGFRYSFSSAKDIFCSLGVIGLQL
jgi:hypothetical protein